MILPRLINFRSSFEDVGDLNSFRSYQILVAIDYEAWKNLSKSKNESL